MTDRPRPPGHQFRNVKPVGSSPAPTILVAAAPECVTTERHPEGKWAWKKAVAVWANAGRRKGDQWLRPADPHRFTLPQFWDWIDSLCASGRRVFVVSPNAADLLTLAEFWPLVEVGRYDVKRPPAADRVNERGRTVKGKPWTGRHTMKRGCDIVTARGAKGSLMFCSSSNYLPATIPELAAAVGYELPPVDRESPDGFPVEQHPSDQVAVLARFFRQAISKWVRDDCGPWRTTAATCALALWQRKFLVLPVTRHQVPEACQLEQDAGHNGRASAWFFGDVGQLRELPAGAAPPPDQSDWPMPDSLCHKVDFRSMHPFILQTELFPVKWRSTVDDFPQHKIPSHVMHGGLIARVELDTSVGEYPLRTKDGVRYPVGRFWTTLAGPELLQAHRDGVIRTMGQTSIYHAGRPFKEMMTYLLNSRQKCLRSNPPDPAGDLWFKQLGNAFGGKFGQKTRTLVAEPLLSVDKAWGPVVLPKREGQGHDLGLVVKGLVYREVVGGVNGRLLAAVFAYLTSYVRVKMRHLRATIGAPDVLAQDTDGLWLTDRGAALASERRLLLSDRPGQLRLCGVSFYSRFFTPRHYYQDGRWTLSGYCDCRQMDGPNRVRERLTLNPGRRMPDTPPVQVVDRIRVKELTFLSTPRHAGPNGWALPDEIDRRQPVATTPEPPDPTLPGLFDQVED